MDASADGTGEIIERLSEEFPHVRVIHRSGKLGIGSAHHEGIRYAYAEGYETLVTMDCDFYSPADGRAEDSCRPHRRAGRSVDGRVALFEASQAFPDGIRCAVR